MMRMVWNETRRKRAIEAMRLMDKPVKGRAMPTRFDDVMRQIANATNATGDDWDDTAQYIRELHYSHGVLLAELRYMKAQLKETHLRAGGFALPQLRADEAIRNAEAINGSL